MKQVYLLTGFLGAGKTTFLKNFIRLFPQQKKAIIVNEFGREAVDGVLLSSLGIQLTEIDNGSIFCSCQLPQFEKALDQLANMDLDILVVEASGLADPTHVRKILGQDCYKTRLCYAGALCLVDAARFHKYISTALVSQKQLQVSDVFVINKTDLVQEDQLDQVKKMLERLQAGAPCLYTQFGRVEGEVLDTLRAAVERRQKEASSLNDPLARQEAESQPFAYDQAAIKDLTLRKLLLHTDEKMSKEDLQAFLASFAADTFRIKGFVRARDQVYFVDSVGSDVSISAMEEGVESRHFLVILYNNTLPAKKGVLAAQAAFSQYDIKLET